LGPGSGIGLSMNPTWPISFMTKAFIVLSPGEPWDTHGEMPVQSRTVRYP
jgi:hypothetical protein